MSFGEAGNFGGDKMLGLGFGVSLGSPDMTIAIDAALFFGAMSALYLGLGTLWAAWSTHRGRRAWAADPIGFLEARAGRSIDAAVDVRQVAVVGAVGNSQWIGGSWILLTVTPDLLVVESMVPWPLHGPKIVHTRSEGPLRCDGTYVRDGQQHFMITVRRRRPEFFGMLHELGWVLPERATA